MTDRIIRSLAWLALAAIIFVTVSPIDLRPRDAMSVDVDRAIPFAMMSAAFVIAYPRRWVEIAAVLLIGVGLIELLQELSPTRHARFQDALVKAVGASIGFAIGWCVNRYRSRRAA